LEQFLNTVEVIEHTGGSVGNEPGILNHTLQERGLSKIAFEAMTEQDEKDEIKKDAQDQYLAVAFLLGSGRSRYGRLIEDLENDYLQGQNNYPKTVTALYNLITNWKQDPRNSMRLHGASSDGVAFTTVNDEKTEEVALANSGKQRGR
jgi:hypothetical protein